ncbi:MAG TPA: hypothetical protein VK557_18155 [Pyrinomonadaceae bacterium]|nr:hypothetical protein [Pyrinomonadaceae bacterium]
MRRLITISNVAIAVLLAASFCASQNTNSNSSPKPEAKPNNHIKTKYNQSKDETTVTLKTLALTNSVSREIKSDSDFGNLDLDISFTYQGKQPSKPVENATFKFKGTAKNQYFQKPQNLIAVIDDTSGVVLGPTSYNSTSETFYFVENMSISIPYAAMQRIVRAKTLAFQLGARNIRMMDDQLADLRAMAALMTP